MESKTLLLALLGFGVAGYLAYQLAKGQTATGSGQAETAPAPSDFGGQPPFGLGNLGQDALCQVAPSLCGWYNRAYVGRPAPLPVVPVW